CQTATTLPSGDRSQVVPGGPSAQDAGAPLPVRSKRRTLPTPATVTRTLPSADRRHASPVHCPARNPRSPTANRLSPELAPQIIQEPSGPAARGARPCTSASLAVRSRSQKRIGSVALAEINV